MTGPVRLAACEAADGSQNGEAGIIRAIFDRIGTTNRQCLEFGAHPLQCNTLALKRAGWDALAWDIRDASDLPEAAGWFHQIAVTPANFGELWRTFELPDDLDFLTIDVDGNDWHIWNALPRSILPRVVCIEINASLPVWLDAVIPIHNLFHWDGSNYFGASLLAMCRLARYRRYQLVAVDASGTNAFFVRDEDAPPGTFADQNDIKALYRPASYGPEGTGHEPDPFNRPYQSSADYLMLRHLHGD